MAVVDHTSSLTPGPNLASMNDRYMVEANGEVVTINFSGIVNISTNAVVANIPAALVPNTSNIFFSVFNHTNKTGAGARLTSGGQIIINDAENGHDYWVGVTYVKRT
ncbi:hypothetical protein SAMN05421747_102337 [Parapedobacter composti]|uniref:Uncharacterized protein n=1 Tax=Parapedobacter composti TaxID=623281 RepID=A0A1I1FBB1_9SPHI|nr:hypothetical protein [Parapedobacter composti]SFB96252.1 hypothetical protein SAMN05421747_102337 [Parapedobacter composti]